MKIGRRVQAMGDRLFVEALQNERKYGSIVIPDNYKGKLDLLVSKVLTVGPEVKAKRWHLWEGDYVVHVRTCLLKYDPEFQNVGTKVEGEYGFIFEKDVIFVIPEEDAVPIVQGASQYTEGKTGEWRQ